MNLDRILESLGRLALARLVIQLADENNLYRKASIAAIATVRQDAQRLANSLHSLSQIVDTDTP